MWQDFFQKSENAAKMSLIAAFFHVGRVSGHNRHVNCLCRGRRTFSTVALRADPSSNREGLFIP
jgi:hypothetical protein